MAWIESHDGLEEHPKLLALAEAMGWNKYEASGRLHAFWKWCLKFAITGDLHKFNDAVLGLSVALNGEEAKRFVKAMTAEQSCWIDRGQGPNGQSVFRVHDWPEFTHYYIKDSMFKRKPQLWAEVLKIYAVPLVLGLSVDSPRIVRHTYPPTNQPDLSGKEPREMEDPNTWPMKVAVNPPVDGKWLERIAEIHEWYCQQMGARIRLDAQIERLWWEWFKAGHDEDQFKKVFKYLRGRIKEHKRNDGAVTLRVMLQPDKFSEDLALSAVQRKPMQEAIAPPIKAPDVKPTPEAMALGKAQLQALKESVR